MSAIGTSPLWPIAHPAQPAEHGNGSSSVDSQFEPDAVVRVRAALQVSRHPMLLADDNRRWITGNDAACELLGVERDELPWHSIDDFTPSRERQRLEERWRAFLTTGSAEGWYQLSVPDREPLRVEFSATANVLPARHLSVFVPPDDAFAEHTESVLAREGVWSPVLPESSGRLQLTNREREVMTLVATGLQTAAVAEHLFLSPETVKSHVHNALGKLGAHTRAHAVAIALVTGQIAWAV